MAKKALIILAEGFEEIEAVTPADILRRAGVDVTVAGVKGLNVKGSRGVTVKADVLLDKVKGEFDACILPGGANGARNLAASEKVNQVIKAMNDSGKLIAAICASPAVVLAPAGILDNKYATCFPGLEESFSRYTTYRNDPVVADGNIITSKGPGTALAFALTIAERLAGRDSAEKVRVATLAT